MKLKEPIIHIVFICDENYVMPTIVAIQSLLMNKHNISKYFIHILASDISEESQKLFLEFKQENFDLEVLDLRQSDELKCCTIENLHVSTAALYKFNIAKLFPQFDKVLYLDGDILIQKDLSELFQTNLDDKYAAVVKDYKPTTYKPPQVVKLGINHTAYFNSGVMLLNLKKFREDHLAEKLLDYRLNGINYFMDQDALNVVFQEKVIYLSLLNNVMSSVMGFFKTEDILNYYELPADLTKSRIYQQATIVHLCTKYKPWDYSNVPFADEWIYYYNRSPYQEARERKKIDDETKKKIFAEIDLKLSKKHWGINTDIVVSLTSFPARINYVPKVIDTILNQTVLPDKILLWLASSQFPGKEKDLPEELLSQRSKGLEINWCEDLRPHKKYYYTMEMYPDSIVITIDDDIYYSNKLIEQLLHSYIKYPYAVSAMRAHVIGIDKTGQILPYSKWKREYKNVGIPSLALCATGVGGVLYPPRIMHNELFNKQNILNLCINADDLWLKTMQLLTNTPVVVAAKPQKLYFIEDTQDVALWKTNDVVGENDIYFANILAHYDNFLSQTNTLTERLQISYRSLNQKENKNIDSTYLKSNLNRTKQELETISNSTSYKVGRFVTFVPRKIKGAILCCQDHGIIYTFKYALQKICNR